jgi:endoglucanase
VNAPRPPARAATPARTLRAVAARVWPLLLAGAATLAVPHAAGQARSPFAGRRMYVDPNSLARRQADQWQRSRPADAARMRVIAGQPQALWLGDWNRDVRADVDAALSAAGGAMVVLVAYNIPHRDCGQYSAGGARDGDAYRRWIISLSQGLRRRPVAIIVEPDALPSMDCLPLRMQDERFVLIREAVQTLKAGGASVYVDAGNANWKQPGEMAGRLRKAGIELADGFSLNVSNFHSTAANEAYGTQLSRLVGGKHFVIDTSRNGAGAAVQPNWCNAPGQALGRAPTAQTGNALVDAFLWVKTPGQSDGTCNGGPRAGSWWADYALELSRAAERVGSMLPR